MADDADTTSAQEAIGRVLAEHVAGISEARDGLVSEWVVVVGIVDEDGEGWVSMITNPYLLKTHRTGLLYEALHGQWDLSNE